jgi:Tol biopolymer transport system component
MRRIDLSLLVSLLVAVLAIPAQAGPSDDWPCAIVIDNSDIYVKLVGSTEVRRLTTDPALDFAPQWSSDGKWIAYARSQSLTAHRIRLMSSLGGSDRALGDFPVRPPATWSPDGRHLVAARAAENGAADQGNGLYLVPVAVGEPRPITRVVAPDQDEWPAFSPEGRRLAYVSCREVHLRTNCHVQLLDLDRTYAPVGPPRRLTRQPFWTIKGLAWSRDGRFVIFGAQQDAFFHLWRVAVDDESLARIEAAGMDAADPATAVAADRWPFRSPSTTWTSTASTWVERRNRLRDRRRGTRALSSRQTGDASPSVRLARAMASRSGCQAATARTRSN